MATYADYLGQLSVKDEFILSEWERLLKFDRNETCFLVCTPEYATMCIILFLRWCNDG